MCDSVTGAIKVGRDVFVLSPLQDAYLASAVLLTEHGTPMWTAAHMVVFQKPTDFGTPRIIPLILLLV